MSWKCLYMIQDQKKNCLGEGSYGKVFPAKRITDGKEMCVKLIQKNLDFGDFIFETQAAKEFVIGDKMKGKQFENLVQIFDCFIEDEQTEYAYLFMERCTNNLNQISFRKNNFIDYQLLDQLILQIAKGYSELVSLNIIHRDFKPENILYNQNKDGSITFKIADFGLSKLIDAKQVQNTKNVGSPVYKAPEVDTPFYDNRCDLYSFGIILFQILIGENEFKQLIVDLTNKKQQLQGKLFSTIYLKDKKNIENEYVELLNKLITFKPEDRLYWDELPQWKELIQPRQRSKTEQWDVKPFQYFQKPVNQAVQQQQAIQQNQAVQNYQGAQSNYQSGFPPNQIFQKVVQPNSYNYQTIQSNFVTKQAPNQNVLPNQTIQMNQPNQQYNATQQQNFNQLPFVKQNSSINFQQQQQQQQNQQFKQPQQLIQQQTQVQQQFINPKTQPTPFQQASTQFQQAATQFQQATQQKQATQQQYYQPKQSSQPAQIQSPTQFQQATQQQYYQPKQSSQLAQIQQAATAQFQQATQQQQPTLYQQPSLYQQPTQFQQQTPSAPQSRMQTYLPQTTPSPQPQQMYNQQTTPSSQPTQTIQQQQSHNKKCQSNDYKPIPILSNQNQNQLVQQQESFVQIDKPRFQTIAPGSQINNQQIMQQLPNQFQNKAIPNSANVQVQNWQQPNYKPQQQESAASQLDNCQKKNDPDSGVNSSSTSGQISGTILETDEKQK